jgi:hypothetical protein
VHELCAAAAPPLPFAPRISIRSGGRPVFSTAQPAGRCSTVPDAACVMRDAATLAASSASEFFHQPVPCDCSPPGCTGACVDGLRCGPWSPRASRLTSCARARPAAACRPMRVAPSSSRVLTVADITPAGWRASSGEFLGKLGHVPRPSCPGACGRTACLPVSALRSSQIERRKCRRSAPRVLTCGIQDNTTHHLPS